MVIFHHAFIISQNALVVQEIKVKNPDVIYIQNKNKDKLYLKALDLRLFENTNETIISGYINIVYIVLR